MSDLDDYISLGQSFIKSEGSLEHYGIVGMKWGVRRYQNYDGSYTKAGLERYNKSMQKYEETKAQLKSISKKDNQKEFLTAKKDYQKAKAELKASYKRLKTDNMADKGRLAAKEGKTITSLSFENMNLDLISAVGASATAYVLNNRNHMSKAEFVPAAIVTAGTTAVTIALSKRNNVKMKEIRSYYNH